MSNTPFVPPPPKPNHGRRRSKPTIEAVQAAQTAAIPTRVVPQRRKDKVAIVGFAPHNVLTPFDSDEWELWGINRLHAVLPGKQWARWFELHALDDYVDDKGQRDEQHFGFLRSFPGDLYIRPADIGQHGLVNAQPFPLDSLLAEFVPYFTNTISYLVALAIQMGFEEIGLWGVDMAQDHALQMEFGEQRPSVEYFLGVAAGRGIKVTIPDGADLLTAAYLYGFGEPSPLRGKLEWRLRELDGRKQQLKAQISGLDNQKTQMVAHLNQLDGAMQDAQYLLRNILPGESKQK